MYRSVPCWSGELYDLSIVSNTCASMFSGRTLSPHPFEIICMSTVGNGWGLESRKHRDCVKDGHYYKMVALK